jgi:hypothetical protein
VAPDSRSILYGNSINDEISEQDSSLTSIRVDNVAERAAQLGPGTQLAKMDIQEACRMLQAHPVDRQLLGMEWEGQLYVDAGSYPIWLRSAPMVLSAVADALQWILKKKGVS